MTAGPDGLYPLPFPGETFLLTRDKISLSFKDSAFNVSGVQGRLFMTNMRYDIYIYVAYSSCDLAF